MDKLIKALGFNNQARIYVVSTTDSVNEIGDRLSYLPSALDSFGRVMSMGAIMGGTMKNDETVTIKVEGNGPIGLILVEADAFGKIRGYVQNPHVHFENNNYTLNSKKTIGDAGTITVIKDLHLKEPFIGFTPIISAGIAEDFAYYYSVSEQIPTAISLGVLVDTDSRAVASGGFMIQLLPNATEEEISKIEDKVKNLPPISELLKDYTLEEILQNIDDQAEILEKTDVKYECNCSKERFAKGILSLGSKEIEDIIKEQENIETICHFCGKKYNFSKDELTNLYNDAIKQNK